MESKGFEVGQVFKLCKQDTNTNKEEEKGAMEYPNWYSRVMTLPCMFGILAHQFKTDHFQSRIFWLPWCMYSVWRTHCKNNLECRKIKCSLDFQFPSLIILFSSPITQNWWVPWLSSVFRCVSSFCLPHELKPLLPALTFTQITILYLHTHSARSELSQPASPCHDYAVLHAPTKLIPLTSFSAFS